MMLPMLHLRVRYIYLHFMNYFPIIFLLKQKCNKLYNELLSRIPHGESPWGVPMSQMYIFKIY